MRRTQWAHCIILSKLSGETGGSGTVANVPRRGPRASGGQSGTPPPGTHSLTHCCVPRHGQQQRAIAIGASQWRHSSWLDGRHGPRERGGGRAGLLRGEVVLPAGEQPVHPGRQELQQLLHPPLHRLVARRRQPPCGPPFCMRRRAGPNAPRRRGCVQVDV